MRATTCCLARHFIVAVLAFVKLAAAEFGGSCYYSYCFTPTTCEEVDEVCSNNDCTTSTNGDMNYYCYDSLCSGVFSVPMAFRSACNAVNLTSCDEAESKFNSIGCSCFTCSEKDGKVAAECLLPYPCTPPQVPQANDNAPELGSTEYGIVSAVYIATAIVLTGSALAVKNYCFPDKIGKKPTLKKITAENVHEEDWWLLYAFSFEAVVEDDGSQMGFYDYFAAKCDLLGFVDCRNKKTKARFRWTRLWAILTSFLVTLSLAMLLGTVVFNNSERCLRTVTVCCDCHTYCDGEDLGCDGCACKPESECSWGYHSCDLNDIVRPAAVESIAQLHAPQRRQG